MKNRFWKIWLCILALTLPLLSLCACNQPAQTTGQTQPSQAANEPQPQQQADDGQSQETDNNSDIQNSNILVAYFSATGNTAAVAEYISETLNAELYEIVPETPYTSEDLDWTDDSSRVSTEHKDPDFRPAIEGEEKDLSAYSTVFLGYPIWWGEAPSIIRTFLENANLSGKTVVPFCTSSSSGIGSSADNLHSLAPDANWLNGQRFSSSVSAEKVDEWVNGLILE